MQSCFKIDLGLIQLSNVKILCLKARVFLVTIVKWGVSGQGYKHCPGFQHSYCLKPAATTMQKINPVGCFNLGLFIYIYFLSFEGNHRNRISRAGKNSPTISLFLRKMIA